MLSVAGLNQFYGQSHILWDVDLEVPAGTCFCLMGRNGVGKTTLLKSIMGLVPIHSGSIGIGGVSLTERPAHARAGLGIGYVPQGREIFSQLSVDENLRIGLAARRDRVREIPGDVFELFPVLREMLGRRGGDLSGGQQQQLALARALVTKPDLLILDEPTEGIQPNIVREIGDILIELNHKRGMTILLVEQKLAFARRVADQFAVLEKGRVVATGDMEKLDADLVARYLTV